MVVGFMRRFIIVLFLALCGSSAAFAAAGPSDAQGILPSSFSDSKGGAWTGGMPVIISQLTAEELSRFAPRGLESLTPVLVEYGFAGAEQEQYQNGSDSILVRVYQMKDPSGGYGLYSFLREPDMAQADFTEHSSMSRDHVLVLDGNLVIDVTGNSIEAHEKDLKPLVSQVVPHAQTGPYPLLWETLPTKDFVPRSDKYILGPQTLNQLLPLSAEDWLGFSNGTEAELARYGVHGRDLTLLVADFPTPQMAAKKIEELNSELATTGGKDHPIYTRRVLTLVALVANAPSEAEANALLGQVHSNLTVTWDQPAFSLTDPNIGTIVVGIIVGTGFLCLFAIIAGLAFGGVRLAVKRLLPGKVFDRAEDIQILQLGLSSKPIDAQDFYGLGGATKR